MTDLEQLKDLNRDYISSVQTSDVKRFDEILAEDFVCSLPDGRLRDLDNCRRHNVSALCVVCAPAPGWDGTKHSQIDCGCAARDSNSPQNPPNLLHRGR